MSTSLKTYIGFADGTYRSIQNISSATWVIYSPTDELVSIHGICLSKKTNNISEYSAIIELLFDTISFCIWNFIIRFHLELVVLLHLNRVHSIKHRVLLRLFFKVRLLER